MTPEEEEKDRIKAWNSLRDIDPEVVDKAIADGTPIPSRLMATIIAKGSRKEKELDAFYEKVDALLKSEGKETHVYISSEIQTNTIRASEEELKKLDEYFAAVDKELKFR
jgi:hypothetical protein